MLTKIIAGGQTGADQGALRAARAKGIATGGYAPRGWLTEDGPNPSLADFGLVQHQATDYPSRTRANVEQADALLWFGNSHSPGGKLTLRLAGQNFVLSFVVKPGDVPLDVAIWLKAMFPLNGKAKTLMVAGNRESKSPGIGANTEWFLGEVLKLLAGRPTP